MFQPQLYPVKSICAILAALSLGLAAVAASARQQDPQPEPETEVAQPPADATGDAQPPAAAPPTDMPPTDMPPTDAPPADMPTEPPAAAPTPPSPEQDAPYVEPVLAERLYEMAQSLLRQENVTEPMWRQAASLLHAASRISPRDPRFPRLLVEARLKVGDTDRAIDALTAYRRVDAGDRVAQIQLIDLYAERIQTADARLDYLRDLLERQTNPPIPEEVRSHVATRCALLLLERSHNEAAAMVEEAMRLYPLNPDALRLQYEMLPVDAAPPARAAVLLAMLQSNPAQPDVANELARLLGAIGLHSSSLEWYTVALNLYPRTGRPFPPGFVADAGAQVLMTGQSQQLDNLLDPYLEARPDDADAWFLKLAKDQAAAEKLDPKAVDEARAALAGNLWEVCRVIAGGGAAGAAAQPNRTAPDARPAAPPAAAPGEAAPTTRPATADDALAAAQRVKAGEAAEFERALVSALTDLAWLEVYFAEDAAAAAKWIGALREVLAADSVTLARLEGWVDLVAGRAEQANTRLSPIADQDPLAAVGMVRLAAQDAGGQAGATELATRLLSNYRTGLVGALVWSALRDRNIQPPEPETAADVRAVVEQFPRDWMEIINQPEAYYEVMAEVGRVAHRYRQPMFGRITIRNKTDHDLTIGPDGVIRPDLWFDARISGLVNRNFPGVAYDRIAKHVVLRARDVISQVVRIDQGALAEALEQNPSASAQVNANVLTNPSPLPSGVGPGPAGQRRVFNKAFVRSGFALSQTAMRKRVTIAIQSGTPGEKIRGLDLLAGYLRMFGRQKQLDASMQKLGNEFMSTISASRRDESRPVAIWAKYLSARLSDHGREAMVDALLADEAWPARLLGLIAVADLGPEPQTELAAHLAEQDPEPAVRDYAAATADFLRSRPATQPATAEGAQAPGDPAGDALSPGVAPTGPRIPSDGTRGVR